MNLIKENKVVILSIICLLLLIGSVFVWNKIIELQKEKDDEIINDINLDDYNNISSVESKLGEDIKISQSYLLNYTSKKASVWYMSKAYVRDIKADGSNFALVLSDSMESDIKITSTIEQSKCNVKKGELINFVGTLDLDTGNLELSKISKEEIDYKSVTEIDFKNLVENFKLVKSNYFLVMGYMITDNDKYKLFDNKSDAQEENKIGKYFLIDWKGEFKYTGNQNVTLKCKIEDTYKLKECELVK